MPNNSGQHRKFRVPEMSTINATYGEAVFRIIRREYAPLKNAAKLLARAAGTSPRTAENWLAGTHAPNGEKLINLMAECGPLADEVMKLVEERRRARGE